LIREQVDPRFGVVAHNLTQRRVTPLDHGFEMQALNPSSTTASTSRRHHARSRVLCLRFVALSTAHIDG
jgi:hypothetical protein